ncbi:hypothetical protein FQZ97_914480 [compost metagenome]
MKNSSGTDSMVFTRADRKVMREQRRRSSMGAGTKPSTRFWWGHSTNHRLHTMITPSHRPMPMGASPPCRPRAPGSAPRSPSMASPVPSVSSEA